MTAQNVIISARQKTGNVLEKYPPTLPKKVHTKKLFFGLPCGEQKNLRFNSEDAILISVTMINQIGYDEMKTDRRLCPSCDKLFTPNSPRQKFCGNACKQAAYRKRIDPHTGTWASLRDRARRGNDTKRWVTREFTCAHCGDTRKLSVLDAQLREYCSNACKQAAYRSRKKQALRAQDVTIQNVTRS